MGYSLECFKYPNALQLIQWVLCVHITENLKANRNTDGWNFLKVSGREFFLSHQ